MEDSITSLFHWIKTKWINNNLSKKENKGKAFVSTIKKGRKWLVGLLEIQFNSFKEPIVSSQRMARNGWAWRMKRGSSNVSFSGIKESSHLSICQGPCEHSLGMIPIISFFLFGVQGQPQQQWTREREFHVLMRRKGIFGPLIDCFHWQFSLICARILTIPIDWKGVVSGV